MLFHSVLLFQPPGVWEKVCMASMNCMPSCNAFIPHPISHPNTSNLQLIRIEMFIIVMYSRTCPATSVEDVIKQLFGQGLCTIENIHQPKLLYYDMSNVPCTKQDMCGHKLLYQLILYQIQNWGAELQLRSCFAIVL